MIKRYLYVLLLLSTFVVAPSAMFLAEYFTTIGIIYYEEVTLLFIYIYSLLPLFITPKKTIGIVGTSNYLIEFEFLKRLVFCGFPLLIVAYTLSLFAGRAVLLPLFYFGKEPTEI